jgi:hypothetical protein
MIISEEIEITVNKHNINRLKRIGYNPIIEEKILISVNKLSKSSSLMIDVKCDYCGSVKKLSFKNYNKSIKMGNKYACSQKCSYDKKSEILMNVEGIENIFQSSVTKDKIKKVNLEKWGVEFYIQSEDFKYKSRKTNKEKFGHENVMQSDIIKEKSKLSNLEKWGGIGFSSKDILLKINKTNLEKWGIEIPSKLEEIKKRIKLTNLQKWNGTGFESEEISKKIKNKLLEKYGSESNTKSEIFRKKHYNLSQDENYINYISDGISMFNCIKGHTFSIHKNNYISRKLSNLSICTICDPIGESSSLKEKELIDFIKSLNINFIKSYRDEFEIDIYIPDFKLGLEFNGLYWHSSLFKDKNYHINKTEFFKKKDIKIFHIWEDDWENKKEIIKSQIKNILNTTTLKIAARKCKIKEIDKDLSISFLNKNHIQGSYNNIKKSVGLYYDNELVSLMCFDQFEGRKKMNIDEWNISRFCSKINLFVIGGASKLLKYFIDNYKPKRIISYADISWSNGNLYKILKFNKIKETKPDYKYLFKKMRVHKSSFRKSKTGISEKYLDIPKIWDCGKIKYEKIL